jgi:hypothetical protein
MNTRVDPQRLRNAMTRKGLSVKWLALKASSRENNISERTIARMLSGKEAGGTRPRTIEAIAKTLGIQPGVLTLDLPEPVADQPESPQPPGTRLNFRSSTATRNAYHLVAGRYGVSAALIAELGPILFLLIAEQSLASRRERLKDRREAYAALSEVERHTRHLPEIGGFASLPDKICAAEKSSIDQRDIFAEVLRDDETISSDDLIYLDDEHKDNPFASFLRARAVEIEAMNEIDRISRYRVEYRLCREQALSLADGDEALADDILDGSIPLHELPSELRRGHAKVARLEWLRQKAAEHHDGQSHMMAVTLGDVLGVEDTP